MINFQIQPRQAGNLRVLRAYFSESYDYLFFFFFAIFLGFKRVHIGLRNCDKRFLQCALNHDLGVT